MNALDAVKLAARKADIKSTEIGPAMGKSRSYIAANASRGSVPKADSLSSMLRVCGYELCALPKDEVPKSAIIIS